MRRMILHSVGLFAMLFGISQLMSAQAPELTPIFSKRILIEGGDYTVASAKQFNTTSNSGGAIPASPRFSEVSTVTYKPTTSTAVPGMEDGEVAVSKWKSPYGLCMDHNGNLIVVEKWNSHRIRKIDLTVGQVSTIAGDNSAETGASGMINANGTNARFNQPTDVIMDSKGNLFVSDFGNYVIRKITPNKDVTTFAGTGIAGNDDGIGTEASFRGIFGLAIDSEDNIYATDRASHRVLKITPEAVVTTIAGQAGSSGSDDGIGVSATFNNPAGIDIDSSGNLYVADAGGQKIRKISPEGAVTTLAGSGWGGTDDGEGINATFYQPIGVAVDEYGFVYVADYDGKKIRRVSPDGFVKTIAGQGGNSFVDNAAGTLAYFRTPSDLVYDKTRRCLYLADNTNYAIRRIALVGYFANRLPAGFSIAMNTGVIYNASATMANLTLSEPVDYVFEGYNTSGRSTAIMTIEVAASGTDVVTITTEVNGGYGKIDAKREVVKGGSTTFAIMPDEEYEIGSIALDGIAQSFTPSQTSFTVTNASNSLLEVSFVEKGTSTSITDKPVLYYKIVSEGKYIRIEGVDTNTEVKVYNVSGRLIHVQYGEGSLDVEKGLYLVQLANKIVKIIH